METKSNLKNRDAARFAAGLLLVGAGAALFVRNMNYVILPSWLFTWPMILILVGIYSGVKHKFSNNSWIILIGLGVFFLVDGFVPELKSSPAFWPLVIAGLGLLFILRPLKKNWRHDTSFLNKDEYEQNQLSTSENIRSDDTADKNEFLRIDSVFSGVNKRILSKNFQGGRISCVFGGAEIDFLQADISQPVKIKVDVVFGGIKLLLPANWSVQSEIDGAFHNIDDKRKYNPGIAQDPGKVLILKGSCVFGGIDIKSY